MLTSFLSLSPYTPLLCPYNAAMRLRYLLFGRKAMTNPVTSTLLTKVLRVKAMVFPLLMYRCQSWIIKATKHQRTDAF